jgi:glyoxylase-like metal-dependent hydrolase (beta-lactamase superfamily II)
MRTIEILALTLVLATAPAIAQQPAATPAAPSLVRGGVSEHLTPHVWAIPDGSAPLVPNVGIVVGSKAVLVVDTGMGARNAATILNEVAKVGAGKPIYIVSTHFHPEHDLAAHAFPKDSKMIRSKDEEQDIAKYGLNLADRFAAMSPLNAELLKDVKYRPADITFAKEYVVDLGGVKARLIAMGPNHTFGDTAIFIASEKVLFAGDIAMRGQPAFASPESNLGHWLKSLKRLEGLKPLHVVPSHGRRGDIMIIKDYEAYLGHIRDRSAALKKEGKSQAETVTRVTDEMSGQYPDQGRLSGAIRAAWNEAG